MKCEIAGKQVFTFSSLSAPFPFHPRKKLPTTGKPPEDIHNTYIYTQKVCLKIHTYSLVYKAS